MVDARQSTVAGLGIATLFLLLSWSKVRVLVFERTDAWCQVARKCVRFDGSTLLAAMNALCLSPQPLPQLSPSRPYSSVFNAPLIVSVVAQFAVHLYFLVQAVDLCIPYLPE